MTANLEVANGSPARARTADHRAGGKAKRPANSLKRLGGGGGFGVVFAVVGGPVEDLISDGQGLALTVSEQLPRLPYGERLVADVSAAVDSLQTAYKAEQALRTERGLREVAEDQAAAVLNQELVVYRRMLRRVVGPAHHLYRMLHRPARTDAEPPDEAEPVTPAGTSAEATVPATATPSTGSHTPAE